MANDRMNKPTLSLNNLIPPDHFRTVDSFEIDRAPKEIPAILQLKDTFRKRLSFPSPWDGMIYAYVRTTETLLDFMAEHGVVNPREIIINISDWDSKFAFSAENPTDQKEVSFFVTYSDVMNLLENCCRVPSQR